VAESEYREEVITVMNSPEFQTLRLEYMQSVLERCDYLSDSAQCLKSEQEVDLITLRHEIHKLRGSGGFYGFTQLSERAAAAEDLILQIRSGVADQDRSALALLVLALVDTAQANARSLGL